MAFFSTKSKDYVPKINELQKPEYESQYGGMISDTLNKILNKEKFSYDFNADPLYKQYKDQYTKLGNEAAMNAAGAASALTGGYGNSYAASAAAQANQQYLTQLNDKIPELYNAAMNKYQMEQEDLYNQFGALQSEESRLYGQHRDSVSDYYNDYANLQQGYNSALQQEDWQAEFDYRKERDAIADQQWQQTFDYNKSRDSVSDSQWQKQFDTSNYQWQQEFDTKNAQWQKEYELALKKARSGGSGGGSSKSSGGSSGTLSNGYTPDYSSNNIRGEITKIVANAANSNDWSVDGVNEYINELAKRKVLDTSEKKYTSPLTGKKITEADWYYETSLINFPQYAKKNGIEIKLGD